MGPGCWWGHGGFIGHYGGSLSNFLMITFVIVLALIINRGIERSSGSSGKEEIALDILKKRYARGEIGTDEFERKKKDLVS